ncbi:hypothetical protein, partial [Falsigemmobacter intermedius]
MAAVKNPTSLRLKAAADDILMKVTGKRMFTNIVTSASIDARIAMEKKRRGGSMLPERELLLSAAKAFNLHSPSGVSFEVKIACIRALDKDFLPQAAPGVAQT